MRAHLSTPIVRNFFWPIVIATVSDRARIQYGNPAAITFAAKNLIAYRRTGTPALPAT